MFDNLKQLEYRWKRKAESSLLLKIQYNELEPKNMLQNYQIFHISTSYYTHKIWGANLNLGTRNLETYLK